MKKGTEETIIERIQLGLKTAEAFEKQLHNMMQDIEENATIIKTKGENVDKEVDKDIIKRIQKDSYSFELLRENMNSTLGVLREYDTLITILEIQSNFTEAELNLLKTISDNNMPIFEMNSEGSVIKADNEIAKMAFNAIEMALNSEASMDKIISSIIKPK